MVRRALTAPEMVAFGQIFGFEFVAHAIGDANRSARVERSFYFVEKNFLPGRRFSSWEDLMPKPGPGASTPPIKDPNGRWA